ANRRQRGPTRTDGDHTSPALLLVFTPDNEPKWRTIRRIALRRVSGVQIPSLRQRVGSVELFTSKRARSRAGGLSYPRKEPENGLNGRICRSIDSLCSPLRRWT